MLGPGQLGIEADEVLNGAGLPPTCDHYEWDERSFTPDSRQVHTVTPFENRLPYETVTISHYVLASVDVASRMMDLRHAEFSVCEGFVQRNFEVDPGDLVELDLADGAFMYVATATDASTRGCSRRRWGPDERPAGIG